MDCQEIKTQLFDFCEQAGPVKLNRELAEHIADCRDCEVFYVHILKAGFKQVEDEKQSEPGPYFTNKTLLSMLGQNKSVFERIPLLRTPVYIASVLLAGILTGILLTDLAPNVTDTTAESPVTTEATDSNTSSDNATLTLNDW